METSYSLFTQLSLMWNIFSFFFLFSIFFLVYFKCAKYHSKYFIWIILFNVYTALWGYYCYYFCYYYYFPHFAEEENRLWKVKCIDQGCSVYLYPEVWLQNLCHYNHSTKWVPYILKLFSKSETYVFWLYCAKRNENNDFTSSSFCGSTLVQYPFLLIFLLLERTSLEACTLGRHSIFFYSHSYKRNKIAHFTQKKTKITFNFDFVPI